jgi:hypothetical protein
MVWGGGGLRDNDYRLTIPRMWKTEAAVCAVYHNEYIEIPKFCITIII